ncbi:GTP pyrophosphokinase [Candidatus Marinarcus aquaticus]|uniref:(P)ppGpp synthetase n=1 Tax=Candidatus Marinarcus aquaticus TaxID=2044504 RepID=A0A4Q0XSV0_9BACT|nr:(p)ppGpp synthetase [Candidatus Marinarcus aquaticus]RXJ60617.1 (p)ppGpp synthetase [Candidatus Marinarcus aquaticus]
MLEHEIENKYNKNLPLYQRAEKNVSEAIKEFLKTNNIPFVNIESRIKKFDSFFEKISRKQYDNPFKENEDFCGIRIILYHLEDIKHLENIIEENFLIEEKVNKSEKLESNEFGYRSNHIIIKIKPEWCVTPNYKGLDDIKIEIQIRTALMHTWAAIEHKLGYKNNQELPTNLIRKLYLMSALLENADMQFQEIKNEAENYQQKTVEESKKVGKFTGSKLNIDTLSALLEYYFPEYEEEEALEKALLNSIIKNSLTIDTIVKYAEKIVPLTPYIDKKINSKMKTTRANVLSYALETFIPKMYDETKMTQSRIDIIKGLKEKANLT